MEGGRARSRRRSTDCADQHGRRMQDGHYSGACRKDKRYGHPGELSADCDEGELAWIGKADLLALPLWAGDKIFLRLLDSDRPFFSLKLNYTGDTLTAARLDGKALDIG